jgi:hypothetical protein
MEYFALSNRDVKKILLDSGAVSEVKIEEAAKYAEQEKTSLAEVVVATHVASPERTIPSFKTFLYLYV